MDAAIATVTGKDDEQGIEVPKAMQSANAYLIAAAPDLLEALTKAQELIHSDCCGVTCAVACAEAANAIAKAEGR